MIKRFNALVFMVAMALAVMTWAGWSPALASGQTDDTAVEETLGQEEEVTDEEAVEDENYEESQEESSYNN